MDMFNATNIEEIRNGMRSSQTSEKRDICWPEYTKQLIPKGWSFEESLAKIEDIRDQRVVHWTKSDASRCGEHDNAYVDLSNGMGMCVRHERLKFVLGELLTFYLALLLEMDNVPVVILSKLNRTSVMWKNVTFPWQDGRHVSMSKVIPNITGPGSHVGMPRLFRQAVDEKFTIDEHRLREIQMTSRDAVELMQWGTMIILDYLSLNIDRVIHDDIPVACVYPLLIRTFIKNLKRSPENKKFWLFDNEYGVLDGYYLVMNLCPLHIQFHKDMLRAMCVFEKNIVLAIRQLHALDQPDRYLLTLAMKHDPIFADIPEYHYDKSMFEKNFKSRIADVYYWMEYCEHGIWGYVM